MPTVRPVRRVVAALSALVLAVSLGASAAHAAPPPNPDAVRTDRVTTALVWGECPESTQGPNPPGLQCASVALPLDYDDPTGPQVQVWVAKHPATDPTRRIGSLFVNPGGPGGPGSIMAQMAPEYFSPDVLASFDIVGFDPRGIGGSTQVVCGTSTKKQLQEWRGFLESIPLTRDEKTQYLNSSKQQAMGCSTTGAPLSASMSTAEVARDMDVLRRLVGDPKLTYLGFSYGTYLGQVYANMYPDRLRAVAIDGVLDPIAWAGTAATADDPVTLRIRSGEGAWQALLAGLAACDAAGPAYCLSAPDARGTFERVAARLKAAPVVIDVPEAGTSITLTYGTFIGSLLSVMYAPDAPEQVDVVLWLFSVMTDPATTPQRAALSKQRVDKVLAAVKEKVPPHTMEQYFQGNDPFWAVLCTDSLNPTAPKAWEPAIAARQAVAPHFSDLWGWQSAVCANRFWTAVDEDAWRGPFDTATEVPVLVVGNRHDPATPLTGAVAAASVLPNSRLLTVDMYGHCAYRDNRCATKAIDDYLLTGVLPAPGASCANEYTPFTRPIELPIP